MDVERCKQIADELKRLGTHLGDIGGDGSSLMSTLIETWSGPDCERLFVDWTFTGRPQIDRSSGDITRFSEDLRTQAVEQDLASDITGPLQATSTAKSGWDRAKDGLVNKMRWTAGWYRDHAWMWPPFFPGVNSTVIAAGADSVDSAANWVDDPKKSEDGVDGAKHVPDAPKKPEDSVENRAHTEGNPQPHVPPKGSPVEHGREYKGTGAGRAKNSFPKHAEPNEVLYRTDTSGKVTYYQVYGADGQPVKRVDIDPNSAPHDGVPPPHVQEYTRETNPQGVHEGDEPPGQDLRQEGPEGPRGPPRRTGEPVMDFDALANPTVAAWADGMDPEGAGQLYLQYEVGVAGVVALAARAMPRLIEVDGLILVESQYDEETFRQWQSSLGEDRAALARTVNYFVVWDELEADGERDDRSDDMAAEFIAACWRARAAADFPGRNIVVEVVDQYGPTVVMYEPNV